jgi:hypothetical protein
MMRIWTTLAAAAALATLTAGGLVPAPAPSRGPTRAWTGTRAATGWSDAGACRADSGGPPISLPTMGGDQRIAQASGRLPDARRAMLVHPAGKQRLRRAVR